MFLLFFTLIFVLTGQGQTRHHQTLHCTHHSSQRSLHRVWCKQSSELCCSGFAFANGQQTLENGDLQVHQEQDSFSVTALRLDQGNGVYWCGLLDNNSTIIRLAEQYFSQTTCTVWSIIRWVLMPLLPLMVAFTHFYTSRNAHKQGTCLYGEWKVVTEVLVNMPAW
ncbi:uncharacterized protein si:ch211-102c2.4 isoform X2 [Conger conger]|uniref:uncharacterized protein si:ch211-102c2.4 isoform X2 n=1 Tax=Conger conger TaxID=82655 RepID=UPI002A5AF385|nr:uncharacterized protein si:ch211-102c2.4 isoform X2 [Conger conger]